MITITERAAREAVRILGEQGKPEARVRVWIAGAGCHGFQYGLGIDEADPKPDDKVFESGGIRSCGPGELHQPRRRDPRVD
jgi:iron-sulfur cluster insertion protein